MRLSPKLHITAALMTAFIVTSGNAEERAPFHLRLQVRVDPASHKLEAEAKIQHPPSSRFYLHKGLSVHQVTADGKPVSFHSDASTAPLPYAPSSAAVVVDAQDTQLLELKYGGEISEVIGGVNMITPDLVELALYSAWFPMFAGTKEFTHYSLLATVEAIFNLGTLGRNDTSATPMSDLFRGGIP